MSNVFGYIERSLGWTAAARKDYKDYRPGYGGDQQRIWQATLGPDTVCFTTHPARRRDDATYSTPNYWTGSGTLPRVAQIDNVVIAVYEVATRQGLYLTNRLLFTHAWLPRDRFDEVIERDGWIFARRGNGYLALRSQHPYRWQTAEGEDANREVIADGLRNIWICELGRRADDGTFGNFTERIAPAQVAWREGAVAYDSPSQGKLEWAGAARCGAMVSRSPSPVTTATTTSSFTLRFRRRRFVSRRVHIGWSWTGQTRSAAAAPTEPRVPSSAVSFPPSLSGWRTSLAADRT